MKKTLLLKAEVREHTGSKTVRKIRKQGRIPAIMYGHKELQYDHLGRNIIHADLMRVDVSEKVKVTVPIELKGIAVGTHEGGIIEEHTDHLEIECKVTDIPEAIAVSVKDVHVGSTLHAGEIELPDGINLVSPPETLLVTCHLVAAAKTTEELEQETPVAPEVIGEVKEPEAEEAPEER